MTDSGRKTAGYVIAGIGFLMILANALEYLLGWDTEFTPLMTIGLVLVVSGMSLSARG